MTLLGTAVVDITPPWPVPLAGFAARTGNFDAIEGRLQAKVFVLASDEAPEALVAIVCADLLWWGPDLVREVTKRVDPLLPPSSKLILHASHTHSGPQSSTRFLDSLGPVDRGYLDWLSSALGPAIQDAAANLTSVRIERYAGVTDIGMNRRGLDPATGRVCAQPRPNGRHGVDDRVTILRFGTSSGEPAGLLVHYACHPVISNRLTVTGDFTATAMELVEAAVGAPVGFLQGCAGDVNPDFVAADEFQFGGPEDLHRYGSRLADAVLEALSSRPGQLIAPAPVSVVRSRVALALDPVPTSDELHRWTQVGGITSEWSRFLLAHPANLTAAIELELSLTTIGRRCALLAFNAEPVSYYGRFVERASNGSALALGYTDGMVGYLVTDEQLAEGGYEPHGSTRYFGLPAPLAAGVSASVESAVTDLLNPS